MNFTDKKLSSYPRSKIHLRARRLVAGIAGERLVQPRERFKPRLALCTDLLDDAVHPQVYRADERDGRAPEHARLRRYRDHMRREARRPVAVQTGQAIQPDAMFALLSGYQIVLTRIASVFAYATLEFFFLLDIF